jgi:hypothetical protein
MRFGYFLGCEKGLVDALLTRFPVCVHSFLGYPRVVEMCPWIAFLFHCGGPVNFQMSSANGLEVAKCQASPLCSCRVERTNSIRRAGYGFRWLISFCTE